MVDRSLVERIEQAAHWAWPPRETGYQDGWSLRADGGRTRRVNSAGTLRFEGSADLDRAIARVEGWYASRGQPACFQLTALTEPPQLDEVLERRGYRRLPSVSILLIDPAAVGPAGVSAIELETRPTALVMNALCDPHWSMTERRVRAELFARIRKPHVFAVLTDHGEPASGGLCVVDGPLAGIFTMRTAAHLRGRGHARAVFRRLAHWARDHGAERIYLQVEDDNAPARGIYEPFGAQRAYGYWYRELGGDR